MGKMRKPHCEMFIKKKQNNKNEEKKDVAKRFCISVGEVTKILKKERIKVYYGRIYRRYYKN